MSINDDESKITTTNNNSNNNDKRKNKNTNNDDARSSFCRCCLSSQLVLSDDPFSMFRIAIVGTGLSGLSTALSLEQVGYRHITLYERDASWDARKEGYGLTLTYDPRGALGALQILDQLAAADCPSRSHYLLDFDGKVQGYFGNAFYNLQQQQQQTPDPTNPQQQQQCRRRRLRGLGQRGNLRVPRQEVRKFLLEKLQHSVIQWEHKLVDIVPANDDNKNQNPLLLVFECANGQVSVSADLVVAADGIHSRVLQSWIPYNEVLPRSLGVRIILGLSQGLVHPLLDERGFYTTHNKCMRLFVMPFAGSRLDPPQHRRFMWQLSFAAASSDDNAASSSSQKLLDEAMSMCHDWHDPVPDLMRATPVSTVWGTMLCDRDPMNVYNQLKQQQQSSSSSNKPQRILVVGDALHAMSPFKGQGANQALQDGRVVADWLRPTATGMVSGRSKTTSRHIDKAVVGCLRELAQRTHKVVVASREVSNFWHYPAQLPPDRYEALYQEHVKFAGVQPGASTDALLRELAKRHIYAGASTVKNQDLDHAIAQVLLENYSGMIDSNNNNDDDDNGKERTTETRCISNSKSTMGIHMAEWESQVWQAIRDGDLGRLRRLSWEGQRFNATIAHLREYDSFSSPLHVAVARAAQPRQQDDDDDDQSMLEWLVREAGCDLTARNSLGQTPMDTAAAGDHKNKIQTFLQRLWDLENGSNNNDY